jgi:cell division protein FtsZ
MDAFRSADEVLLNGVQGITDLITTPGLINVDFADVKGVMSGAGTALMGIGSARGDGRALKAAEIAINSPLLEASMEGALGVLLSVAGGSDLGLFEINEAASLVQEAAHPEANIIFGTVIDDSLGDEVRVTVIAAGFEAGGPTHKKLEPHAYGSRAGGVIAPGVSGSTSGSGYGPGSTNGHGGSGQSAGAGRERTQGYGGAPAKESTAVGHGGSGGHGSDAGYANSPQAGASAHSGTGNYGGGPAQNGYGSPASQPEGFGNSGSAPGSSSANGNGAAESASAHQPSTFQTGTLPPATPPSTAYTPPTPRLPDPGEAPSPAVERSTLYTAPSAHSPSPTSYGSPATDFDDEVDVPPFMKR